MEALNVKGLSKAEVQKLFLRHFQNELDYYEKTLKRFENREGNVSRQWEARYEGEIYGYLRAVINFGIIDKETAEKMFTEKMHWKLNKFNQF